jgi:hypothetical protein
MNQVMDLRLEEMEEMAAPLEWYWWAAGIGGGFLVGVGVGALIAT